MFGYQPAVATVVRAAAGIFFSFPQLSGTIKGEDNNKRGGGFHEIFTVGRPLFKADI
ncbi:hypothetical protein [Salipaludibacillus aurantiacus]|uniref:hypothetical protein n=1 Tax=Salipaludibacillus aurantiacus TaxID=1601833 RepID=UPI0015A69DC9|nr:hypothetical protein [Salipaludibacillus aurantiacus]